MKKLLRFFFCFFITCFFLLVSLDANAAFTSMDYPILSPEQASPWSSAISGLLSGIKEGVEARQHIEEIKAMQLQNQMMKQQIEEEKYSHENVSRNQIKVMIFSQNARPRYLGCVNCSFYMNDSIHNDGSQFGSKRGKKSIYNTHGIYGSNNSDLSICNPRALHPPFIIDNRGVFYGFLTLNTSLRNAIKEPAVLKWLETQVCNI